MASVKQQEKWAREGAKINDNPEYINAYIEYKQKAKQADQRLVRLEALAHEEHFKGVLEFAYKRAISDIKHWGGDKRFNTAPPATLTEIEAKIKDIEHFLRPDNTSTKSGILKIYKKRADTINSRYGKDFGVKFTWQDIANYYESETSKKLDKEYGSKTLIRALAVIKGVSKEKIQEIKDINERVQRVSSDKVVNKVAERLLELGYDYNELMGGKK